MMVLYQHSRRDERRVLEVICEMKNSGERPVRSGGGGTVGEKALKQSEVGDVW